MSSWTTAGTTESAIPLLSIPHEHHNTAMDLEGVAEKYGGQSIAVGPTESPTPNPYGSHATIDHEDEALVDNQGRLRRLFSFVQLLAFALTFMSSWEVIAM